MDGQAGKCPLTSSETATAGDGAKRRRVEAAPEDEIDEKEQMDSALVSHRVGGFAKARPGLGETAPRAPRPPGLGQRYRRSQHRLYDELH